MLTWMGACSLGDQALSITSLDSPCTTLADSVVHELSKKTNSGSDNKNGEDNKSNLQG